MESAGNDDPADEAEAQGPGEVPPARKPDNNTIARSLRYAVEHGQREIVLTVFESGAAATIRINRRQANELANTLSGLPQHSMNRHH